jgi:hypothetical protein
LCTKEREFEAFLDLLIRVYLRVILLLRQQREDKRMILKDTSTGNLLRTSGDSSDGESHADDDNDGDDCDNDNGRDAGRASVEVARVPALVSAISQRLSVARGDIQRYVAEVQHDGGKYRELGNRLFRATSDGSDVILVNALFGLIPLLLHRVDSTNIVGYRT